MLTQMKLSLRSWSVKNLGSDTLRDRHEPRYGRSTTEGAGHRPGIATSVREGKGGEGEGDASTLG